MEPSTKKRKLNTTYKFTCSDTVSPDDQKVLPDTTIVEAIHPPSQVLPSSNTHTSNGSSSTDASSSDSASTSENLLPLIFTDEFQHGTFLIIDNLVKYGNFDDIYVFLDILNKINTKYKTTILNINDICYKYDTNIFELVAQYKKNHLLENICKYTIANIHDVHVKNSANLNSIDIAKSVNNNEFADLIEKIYIRYYQHDKKESHLSIGMTNPKLLAQFRHKISKNFNDILENLYKLITVRGSMIEYRIVFIMYTRLHNNPVNIVDVYKDINYDICQYCFSITKLNLIYKNNQLIVLKLMSPNSKNLTLFDYCLMSTNKRTAQYLMLILINNKFDISQYRGPNKDKFIEVQNLVTSRYLKNYSISGIFVNVLGIDDSDIFMSDEENKPSQIEYQNKLLKMSHRELIETSDPKILDSFKCWSLPY